MKIFLLDYNYKWNIAGASAADLNPFFPFAICPLLDEKKNDQKKLDKNRNTVDWFLLIECFYLFKEAIY